MNKSLKNFNFSLKKTCFPYNNYKLSAFFYYNSMNY
jgi:hypothetical protein